MIYGKCVVKSGSYRDSVIDKYLLSDIELPNSLSEIAELEKKVENQMKQKHLDVFQVQVLSWYKIES